MKIGLVGFSGSGKSTLFRALTHGRATAASGPEAVPVASVAATGDEYLDFLEEYFDPKKVTPLTFTIHDFAALAPRGARLAAVRDQVEGLVLVVRGFTTDACYYERPEADPARDAYDLAMELIFADLDVVSRRVEKLEVSVTKPTPKQDQEKRELAMLRRVAEGLGNEIPVKAMELSPEDRKALKSYSLLTAKPWLVLVSLPDEGGEELTERVEGPFEATRGLRVKLEADLMELDEEERAEFMADLGVEKLHLPGFLDELLDSMGILRFYTAGPKEARAWELRKGEDAVTAAGKIHTDIGRGFIRAEIVNTKDLMAAGSMKATRDNGTYRTEGRHYVVKDGDWLNVLFSV